MKTTITALMLAISFVAFADEHDHEHDQPKAWGLAELKEAQEAALASFKETLGEEALAAIEGFSVDKNIQGTAANARVTYKKDGKKLVQKYFCHVHDTEIDCH